jgi:enoyl-CoA hydratase
MNYETLIVETRDRVGLITLNRPQALNALNSRLLEEMLVALDGFAADDAVGAVVITGSEKAFAAGADIKEMKDLTLMDTYVGDYLGGWDRLALGGGCELALACDFIIAAENAKFGQPEITLGIIPGIGGTQRLTRAVGKAKAMDMVLTGRMIDVQEAERIGLVARIVPTDKLIEEALAAAAKIASFSRPSVLMAKEAVNRAFETTLSEGLRFERRAFHSLFATEDQKEGMSAFIEKRKPEFRNC